MGFWDIFKPDSTDAKLTAIQLSQERTERALFQFGNQLTAVETKVGDLMADFTNAEQAIERLTTEVGEIKALLESDATDQAKLDAITTKINSLSDALDAHTPAPVEPVE
jgi:chromosome segregation ATPase